MKKGILVKRILLYFVLVLLTFLVQTCVFPMFTFLYALPNLILIVTISYGFIYGSMTGIICGVFAGLMMDVSNMQPFGMYMLIFSYIGFFSGLFKEQLMNDSLVFPTVLCVGSELFYNAALLIYKYLSLGTCDVGSAVTKQIFPETFFSVLVTLAVYKFFLYTNRKLDRMDNLRGKNVA